MTVFHQAFNPRQYMVTPDFEYFHYKDHSTMEVEYHNHDFYEIYFLISGNISYIIEGKSYRLKPGDILLINNRQLHKPVIEPGETYERVVIWVNPGFVESSGDASTNLSVCFAPGNSDGLRLLRPDEKTSAVFTGILGKFEKACMTAAYGNSILKSLYLTELLVFLNKGFLGADRAEIETDPEFNEKISMVIQYINSNLEGDLSLDYLSSKFFISKYHMLREFRRNCGFTIHKYIKQKRLILSKTLLREGVQLTEVCSRCGFRDYSNFIRSFKNSFGISPKKYQRAHFG